MKLEQPCVKVWIITAVMLAIYTGAVILFFAFIPHGEKDTNTNDARVQQYYYVDFNNKEKAAVYNAVGIDTGKLTSRGFAMYHEDFLTPLSYPKELHVINLAFEDIYCSVTIFVHADEVKWVRERTTVKYAPFEVIGLQFERNGSTLKYDDAERGVIFLLHCSSEPESAIYQEFLSAFFGKENE